MRQSCIAVTGGEPAGVGYDILVQAAQEERGVPWLVFADPHVLQVRAALLGLPLTIEVYQENKEIYYAPNMLTVWPTHCAAEVIPGKLNPKNSLAVMEGLAQAAQFCLAKKVQGLVTLPAHKGIINEAGIPFTGHTEFFAQLCGIKKVVMMLASKTCRVALVTTHLPLRAVPEAITEENLSETILIVAEYLKKYATIQKPRILVMGLNPHAGENGYLGREEIDVITPTLEKLRREFSLDLKGPLAADTLFQPKYLESADVVIAMYHDQGLAPLKARDFGEIVNITCGLPFLRTSVDHGVALDIAGTGKANIQSFLRALSCF